MTPFRVLITGINERIGTILQNALQNDYEVYGLDRAGGFSEQILSVVDASTG
jgi:nucleoside-diphosphate-sugar epimerase